MLKAKIADSLCNDCRNAIAGRGCPHIDNGEPVPGWAIQNTIADSQQSVLTQVLVCPAFELDDRAEEALHLMRSGYTISAIQRKTHLDQPYVERIKRTYSAWLNSVCYKIKEAQNV